MNDDLPADAITAAAVWLHDEDCNDGDTTTCGRWNSPSRPGMYQAQKHIDYYRDKARGILEAAAPVIREQAAAAERERIRRFAAAMRSDSAGDSDVLALIHELETAAATAERARIRSKWSKAIAELDDAGDFRGVAWLRAFAAAWLDDPADSAGADAQPGTADEFRSITLLATERRRQVEAEGWTPEHDAAHGDGVLARAGACYAWFAAMGYRLPPLTSWPWDERWWKPGEDSVRTLVKAGALIAAEIDRMLSQPGPAGGGAQPGEPATRADQEAKS